MHITVIIVAFYIFSCCLVGAAPWRFSQVNARYFSREKRIFSKLDIDKMIPERWRLKQSPDSEKIIPTNFPVFLKPEWGQNGSGIVRADDAESLARLRKKHAEDNRRFMIQEAATGLREYEIFGARTGNNGSLHEMVTVTESTNNTGDRFPVNSIYNDMTVYRDVTDEFSNDQLAILSGFISEIGDLGIARVSVRADNQEKLLAGEFKIIEVNMFIPMPINLLDPKYSWMQRLQIIFKAMMHLAHATKNRKRDRRPPAILTHMVMYGRKRAAAEKREKELRQHPIGTRRTHP